jgi:hypothetical protein
VELVLLRCMLTYWYLGGIVVPGSNRSSNPANEHVSTTANRDVHLYESAGDFRRES